METKTLKISGMSCSHCEQSVSSALRTLPGVSQAQVNLKAGTATVTYDPAKVSLDKMREAIDDAGYELVGPA